MNYLAKGVGFFESIGQTPRGKLVFGLAVGAISVTAATYALMRIKGIPGGAFDGVKIGASCPYCRYFWTGVGLGIIGTIWATYGILKGMGGVRNGQAAPQEAR